MFNIGDVVNTAPTMATQRQNGKVKYIACPDALKSNGAVCDKKSCQHAVKEYIWVLWPGAKATMSYHENELVLVKSASPVDSEDKKEDIEAHIAIEEKQALKDKFADIETGRSSCDDTRPAQPKDWDVYNGFDKRWASKKDYPDRPQLKDEELTPEWWRKYHGLDDERHIDRRTIR